MALKLITAPSIEPVSLTEMKSYLREVTTDHDTTLTNLIASARDYVEKMTGRALLTQTWELTLDDWPARDYIELDYPPLASVTSIKYTDSAGVENTLAASAYLVDTSGIPGRVCLKNGQSWPSDELQDFAAIKIRYVAGDTLASAVSPNLRAAVFLYVANRFEMPDRTEITDKTQRTIDALIGLERLIEL